MTPCTVATRLLCPWDSLQARILEWVAISYSRDLLDPGMESPVGSPALAGRLLTTVPPGKPKAQTVLCGQLNKVMLKLKLQYFGHLMQRADSFEKTLMLGKIGGRRRRG